LWLAIQTTPVQNWLVGIASNKLSKELGTKVFVKHVDFSLFNRADIEGVLVEDKLKDTILVCRAIKT
jgi:hypothetical protein